MVISRFAEMPEDDLDLSGSEQPLGVVVLGGTEFRHEGLVEVQPVVESRKNPHICKIKGNYLHLKGRNDT